MGMTNSRIPPAYVGFVRTLNDTFMLHKETDKTYILYKCVLIPQVID